MVWPGPIAEYFDKRRNEDGLSAQEVFAELSGKNVAEWVRSVLCVDDLQVAYDTDEKIVRSLLTDVVALGDLTDKLLDDDMRWRGLTLKPASELDYDGKPILDLVREKFDCTLKYPKFPCLVVENMQGERESFVPLECINMCHSRVYGQFYRMYRPL